MNSYSILLACANLALVSAVSAQVFNPPPAAPANNNPGNTTIVQKENKPAQRSALGTDLPAVDPGSEVAIWDGKAWNINDNRVFSARFERYLGEPEAAGDKDKEYIATIREILDLLSPLNQSPDKMRKAVALLPVAASHPQDANLCDALLNAIFRAYLSQQNSGDLEKQIVAMKDEAKRLEYKGDMKAEERKLTTTPSGAGGTSNRGGNSRRPPQGGGGGGQAPQGVAVNSLEYGVLSNASSKSMSSRRPTRLATSWPASKAKPSSSSSSASFSSSAGSSTPSWRPGSTTSSSGTVNPPCA